MGSFDLGDLITLFASLIFAVLVRFMIWNQVHALSAIKGDVERLRKRLKSEGHLVEDLATRFAELDELHRRQWRVLMFCLAVTVMVVVFSVGLFAFCLSL